MNVFTFDDKYYFDREPHDECWCAYTHPASESFSHGSFSVSTCTFERGPDDGRAFTDTEKREVEQILKARREAMDLAQFDVHSVLPCHYKLINPRSNRFSDFIDRLKWMSRCDPTFSVAYEKLTLRQPAYRLTREFIKTVFGELKHITREERSAWLDEVTRDTWTYDHDSAPNETYDEFFRSQERKLMFPDPVKMEVTPNHELFEIEQLPLLYLLEEHKEFAGHKRRHSVYYVDIGTAFAPTPLPAAYIL
jgi:hypothetical protein